MLASLGVAALALRSGLRLRRGRRSRTPRGPELRRRHLRLAKPAVVLVLVGFAGGPPSWVWLRGNEPFSTFHAAVGLLVAALFAAAGVLGRRIEAGRSRAFDAHAALGAAALLLGALAAVAGFVLLP
jgi:hypothetical protein